jgi:hypothetical protein
MTKTPSQRIGQLWTDSVAYVALLAGAGLSIAGNVANTLRVRGDLVDALDIWMAVAFPALVVLMVEVFVSARWKGLPAGMQWLRWIGCLAIGASAMRISWVHLHELMLSRDATADVAVIGPLAIDALAIMATALILAGRGQVRPAAEPGTMSLTLDNRAATFTPSLPLTPVFAEPTIADEATSYLERLAGTLDSETTPAHPIDVRPVSAPPSNAVKPESVPADAADLIMAWMIADLGARPTQTQVNEALAAQFEVSPRTARRWVSALKGAGV